jgi:TPR repeat protein
MKIKFLLTAILMLFCLNYTNAQSHISTGKYACRLVPKSLGYEKYTCPACAANDVKVAQAKAAEDKRKSDAAIAKANADKAASDLAYKKKQKEREEKNKVTEVGLSMSSGSSSTSDNSSTSTETTNSNSISETPIYTPTYTKQDVTNQAINQAATLAGGLINDWNANYERKQKIRETENNERWNRIDQRAMNRFKFYYDQLINLANSGNENAQMILYLESNGNYGDDRAKALPLREVWYEKALKNKNTIALLTKINTSGYYIFEPYEENKQLLHELADAGNVDAMVMLGLWYSQRPNRPSYIYKRTIYDTTHGHMKGGSNQELAIKYLTAAAEKGSPNAMYYLGLIYRDGKINIITYPLKFKIEKNEKLAFEWFSKSIIPSYKESLYYTHHITNGFYNGSYFASSSYFALAEMYEKGQVVPKDIEKAQELRRLGEERYEYIRKNRGFIE